jgi:hypothetical protein
MPQNPLLSRLAMSVSKGLVPAVLASAVLALPLQLVSEAQEQAPLHQQLAVVGAAGVVWVGAARSDRR